MSESELVTEWLHGLPEDLREEFEERAGIMEYEGGLSRQCAEFAAMAILFQVAALRVLGVRLFRTTDGRHLLVSDRNASFAGEAVEIDGLCLRKAVHALGDVAVLSALEK